MRIVIDLQAAQTGNRFRGIGRYATSFALAMARNAGEHEIWLVLNAAFPESIVDIRHTFDGIVPNQRIRIFKTPTPADEIDGANAWRVRAAEIIREHFIQRLRPDVVLLGSLFEGFVDTAVTSVGAFSAAGNTAVILYDLIPLRNQAVYLPTPAHLQHYERKIASLRKAGLLLAISDYSRQDAIAALGLEHDRVVSISAAIDAHFQPRHYPSHEVTALRERFGITRKMVLYAPGGFDARKNFEGLIQAYTLLPSYLRADHQLVIVSRISDGDRASLTRLRTQAGIADDEFVLTGYVSEDELVALYNLATLFVFPSKYEGFGLPALEAMACGAPTIGADSTSVPEVIGWEDALFDPASAQSIADKMVQVLSDEGLRAQLREHGLRQAGKFSWDTSAKRAIAEFEARQSSAFGKAVDAGAAVERTEPHAVLESIAAIITTHAPLDSDLVAVANAIAFNTSGDISKQLLIDISEIVQRDAKSGIQRVVRSILLELLTNAPQGYDVRPIYFDGHRYRYATTFAVGFLGKPAQKSVDQVAEFNQGDIYLALDLNAHLARMLHALHLQLQHIGVEVFFVVYDILLVRRPDWWHEGTSTVFEEWLRSITQVATGLVCISSAVADDVQEWLNQNKPVRRGSPVISSFHLGADVENSLPSKGMPDNANAVLNQLKARLSFLMVGTLEPRKGHGQTLAAFELLWAQDVDANLVIVGKQGWLVDALTHNLRHHAELGKHLFWLEGISDEYLEKVYAASTCLLAASEGEGFGLPLIESAQHQRPIIARDLPVFREVAGEHAFYFDGLDPVSLANTLGAWLALNASGLAPQSVDMPWLTWQQSVNQLLARILPVGSA
jgi:glycosyltransferase involved in cell wall biosynthesis